MKDQSNCNKKPECALGKKIDINHYGYKNSICIDAEHGFIRRFLVTPTNILDAYVWADSAYSDERFKDLLSLAGFENRIHETGSRNHPLSTAARSYHLDDKPRI